MKRILVINTGSSSVKFKLFAMPEETRLAAGIVENIGDTGKPAEGRYIDRNGAPYESTIVCRDHKEALSHLFEWLGDTQKGGMAPLSGIDAVGHRVVHGGERFFRPMTVTSGFMEALEKILGLAPLHLPLNLIGIRACMEALPETPQVACFDTAFFRHMPLSSALYPVPLEWYEKHGVRRYGFHGISYEYLAAETARMLGKPLDELKIIAAHLGNGCSITAIEKGVVRDTSMGFTPLEGLMMGTRSGTIDPAVFPYMMARTGSTADALLDVLNTKSGLGGISGIGRDMREIVSAMENGHERAGLAFDMFIHMLKKYVGAYCFCMGGADAVVLSGGIGENAPEVREALFKGLFFAGLRLDADKNLSVTGGRAGMIHADDARVKILVIPANEELMIARSVFAHIGGALSQPLGFSANQERLVHGSS